MKDKFYLSFAPRYLTIASGSIWTAVIMVYLSVMIPQANGYQLVSEWPLDWVVITMVLSTAAFFTSISLAAYQHDYKLSKEDLARLIKAGYISMKSVSELLDQSAKEFQSPLTYFKVFIQKTNEQANAINQYKATEYKEILAAKEKQKEDVKLFLNNEIAKHGVANE